MTWKNNPAHLQAQVLQLLPEALSAAIESYRKLSQKPAPKESKEVKEHHAALKTCAAHIEYLLKLNLAVQKNQNGENTDEMLQAAMAEAEKEISAFE